MPLYEYRCENGHTFDALQKFSDDPISSCEICGAPSQRVLHPVAIHFKGSGFYSTDYGRGKKAASESKSESSGSDSKSSSGDSGSSSSSGDSGSSSSSGDSGSSSKPKAAEA